MVISYVYNTFETFPILVCFFCMNVCFIFHTTLYSSFHIWLIICDLILIYNISLTRKIIFLTFFCWHQKMHPAGNTYLHLQTTPFTYIFNIHLQDLYRPTIIYHLSKSFRYIFVSRCVQSILVTTQIIIITSLLIGTVFSLFIWYHSLSRWLIQSLPVLGSVDSSRPADLCHSYSFDIRIWIN